MVSCISLLSDFGASSEFVGICHGVALSIAPEHPFVDLCQTIAPGNVREAAFVLATALSYLPPGVHVAVVDPGVGSARRPIALRCGEHLFVGPDNGIFTWAIEAIGHAERPDEAVVLDRAEYWLGVPSHTFHGRDIFVPVAAYLANGTALSALGTAVSAEGLVALAPRVVRNIDRDAIEAEILRVDTFGNLTTSVAPIQAEALGLRSDRTVEVTIGTRRAEAHVAETFADVDPGRALLHVDSNGFLAVAINGGRADLALNARSGDRVLLRSQD